MWYDLPREREEVSGMALSREEIDEIVVNGLAVQCVRALLERHGTSSKIPRSSIELAIARTKHTVEEAYLLAQKIEDRGDMQYPIMS